jgi:replicative DNA helicase
MSNTILLPFQPDAMTPAQLAAVCNLARYSGRTHKLYTYQLRRWFACCETNGLDPGEADLIVAKYRNGPTRDLPVAFQGYYSRFVDRATGPLAVVSRCSED